MRKKEYTDSLLSRFFLIYHNIHPLDPGNDVNNLCLSQPIFYYYNILVVLKEVDDQLKSLADLADKTIYVFPRAKMIMGRQFADSVSDNLKYHAMLKQQQQAKLLMMGIADVSVGDLHIFIHSIALFNCSSEQKISVTDFNFYRIKNASVTRMAFKNSELCYAVNQVISQDIKIKNYQSVLSHHGHQFDLNHIIYLEQ